MSSELLTAGGDHPGARNGHVDTPARRPRRAKARRPHGPVNRWWIRLHRWTALVLGLLFLVEATTGAVLLYGNDLAELAHPERYRATPSDNPLPPLDALRMVQARHPGLGATGVQRYGDIYLVRGAGEGRRYTDAFVDPGSGRINGIGGELPEFVLLMINIHDCGLTCPGLPGYQEWMTAKLPPLFGKEISAGYYLLGLLGVLGVFLAVSGAIVWWPGLRALAGGFLVRRGRGAYTRDLDLHRVIGIVAVPFLLMWGFTGAAFFYDWPARAYFAALPGSARPDPAPPTPGTGPLLTFEQARDVALAAHPDARVAGLDSVHPEQPGGMYTFRLARGHDPYEYWNWSGSISVAVDSHGGGIQDYAPTGPDTPATQRLWDEGFYYGLHFGTLVGPGPRVIWLLFGLTPIPLAVTGLTVWLTKRRSARNRRRRARASTL
ncbi:PepSY-associated TM helix domain-containing protein [Pseudonocardia eucalypti]|uniref:PepSY-associated TM helix domain-containing protein n=1 Tax=Pseudonocardia eucalypti TaxID=648755 RepID=A0ABP9Q5M2_9PSEU|nr:putative iron-regulated membrane protein [Pseudonocardia eucalypti]